MDFSALTGNITLIVIIIALVLLQLFFIRRRKPVTIHREIVERLLSEIRLNLGLATVFRPDWRVKKFETVSWQLTKTKLDFITQPVRRDLTDAFTMIEDYK